MHVPSHRTSEVKTILGNECIGDSLITINNNFHELSKFVAPSFTESEILSRTHYVNTLDKKAGSVIYDLTNHHLLVAAGSLDVSPWFLVDGSLSVTPS